MTKAFSGIVGADFGGSAELHADVLRIAPPITADIEAVNMERRDSEPGPCAS
ncbi:hypothetical protein [Mycolicibacterium wolinskyi]|uniref:hypothetical protein n=1 Tax=Mycolicibacterium wolinskyi TaxID=59750 RepID=UPI00391773E9